MSGNHATPTASVKVTIDGREVIESGVGVGPVDAALNALRKAIMGVADIKLDEYRVEAITGGTDALVDVWVKMSRDGRVISARGAGPDIYHGLGAGIRRRDEPFDTGKERRSKAKALSRGPGSIMNNNDKLLIGTICYQSGTSKPLKEVSK